MAKKPIYPTPGRPLLPKSQDSVPKRTMLRGIPYGQRDPYRNFHDHPFRHHVHLLQERLDKVTLFQSLSQAPPSRRGFFADVTLSAFARQGMSFLKKDDAGVEAQGHNNGKHIGRDKGHLFQTKGRDKKIAAPQVEVMTPRKKRCRAL